MKKALNIILILCVAVISTACINNMAVQELNNKANEYMQKGEYEAAMSRLQASLDLDSSMYQTYYNLGVAAINAEKYETAIEALEGGIGVKSDYSNFYYSLGVAQIGLADEIMEKAAETEMENKADDDENNEAVNPEEIKNRAVVLKQNAIKNLEKYLKMEPNTSDKESIQEMIKQSEEFISGSNEQEKAQKEE